MIYFFENGLSWFAEKSSVEPEGLQNHFSLSRLKLSQFITM